MTRARIMRVNSRQKRVTQIRASFVKDARRQMRVDTRSLAGALFFTVPGQWVSHPIPSQGSRVPHTDGFLEEYV